VRRAFALAIIVALVPVVAAAAAMAAAAAAPIVVRLAPDALVHGDDVILSDIADIEGTGPLVDWLRAVRVAPAPPAGGTQPVTADAIRARLSPHMSRVQLVGAGRVSVTRAFQMVRGADLIDAVRREARTRLDAAESKGEPSALLPISRPEDLRVPTGEVRLETRLHESAAGAPTLIATVTVRVNNRERHQVVLTFQVARMVSVIVVTRPLEPRRTLAADDFRRERRAAGEVPPDALADLADPADLEVLRPVQAGEVLTPRVIRTRVAVKRGELVTLLLEGDGFRITTQGQANEDARRGDAVRVLNISSKREVLGWVEGGGVVRVPYRTLGAER
jgi:flagella basal body P-ring formation protein FlgA